MVSMEQLQVVAQGGEHPDLYTKDEFIKMELYLLQFFNWSVFHPTAATFADYFLSHDEEDEEEAGLSDSLLPTLQEQRERRAQMERLTSCFLDALLRGARIGWRWCS